jgi:hypothetical protein
MTKQLGPTFADDIHTAGLAGLSLAWGATDDTIVGRENLTAEQNTTLDGVIAAHSPDKKRGNLLATSEFLTRWTNAEYLALEKQRAADVAANKVGNAKNWDIVTSEDFIDPGKQKVSNLKADLVADGVLTQTRADEIFAG